MDKRRFKELDKVKIKSSCETYPGYEGIVYHRELIGSTIDILGYKLSPNELLKQAENYYQYGVTLLKDNNGNKCNISAFFTDNDMDLI